MFKSLHEKFEWDKLVVISLQQNSLKVNNRVYKLFKKFLRENSFRLLFNIFVFVFIVNSLKLLTCNVI